MPDASFDYKRFISDARIKKVKKTKIKYIEGTKLRKVLPNTTNVTFSVDRTFLVL